MTKISRKNFKPAFTLAEVLITLTIIGVIAAMVIPTLMQKHIEAEMISKLKKNFTVFSNVIAQAIRENGTLDTWDMGEVGISSAEGSEKFYNYIKPYLKVQKECGNEPGCFATKYNPLFGTSNLSGMTMLKTSSDRIWYQFILEDGTAVSLISEGTGCDATWKTRCAYILLDLNNKRGPNRLGIDVFQFEVRTNAIIPYCLYTDLKNGSSTCEYKGTATVNGYTCAPHVLYKGNMDYLHKDISNEWKNYVRTVPN